LKNCLEVETPLQPPRQATDPAAVRPLYMSYPMSAVVVRIIYGICDWFAHRLFMKSI